MSDQPDNRVKYMHGLAKKTKLGFRQRICRISRIIRANIETPHPVRVKTVGQTAEMKKLNALGYCYLANSNKPKSKRYFVIVIPRNTDVSSLVELLVHEWAHAMAWYDENKGDHGPRWAKAYSSLYQLIIDD
jgi:hypothetical protein